MANNDKPKQRYCKIWEGEKDVAILKKCDDCEACHHIVDVVKQVKGGVMDFLKSQDPKLQQQDQRYNCEGWRNPELLICGECDACDVFNNWLPQAMNRMKRAMVGGESEADFSLTDESSRKKPRK